MEKTDKAPGSPTFAEVQAQAAQSVMLIAAEILEYGRTSDDEDRFEELSRGLVNACAVLTPDSLERPQPPKENITPGVKLLNAEQQLLLASSLIKHAYEVKDHAFATSVAAALDRAIQMVREAGALLQPLRSTCGCVWPSYFAVGEMPPINPCGAHAQWRDEAMAAAAKKQRERTLAWATHAIEYLQARVKELGG